MRVVLLVASCAVLGGCINLGGGDDLSYVCEGKPGSPRPAYGPDELALVTTLDDEAASLPEDEQRAILRAVSRHVITLEGHGHTNLSARIGTLDAAGGDGNVSWRFEAEGDLGDVRDEYNVLVRRDGGSFVASPEPPFPDPVEAPPSLQGAAEDIVSRSAEARALLPSGAEVQAAGWDPELPSCVRLHYAQEADPAEAERATLVVNVVRGLVVTVA